MNLLNCVMIILSLLLSFAGISYSQINTSSPGSVLIIEEDDVLLSFEKEATDQITADNMEDYEVEATPENSELDRIADQGPADSAKGDEAAPMPENNESDSIKEISDKIPADDEDFNEVDYMPEDNGLDKIADPLEPVNRIVFHFNDKLYFWLLKPVAKGYSFILPEDVRISVRNFFVNISAPVRIVNNLLQLKIKGAGNELLRFGVNSTMGMLGLYDVAKDDLGMSINDEDFGQTLGVWGAGPGIFINWPFIGPSSLRDSAGYAGDYFLEPLNYLNPAMNRMAVKAGDGINSVSLSIGDYEGIKKDALDPYNAFKDIYYQYRKSKIDR